MGCFPSKAHAEIKQYPGSTLEDKDNTVPESPHIHTKEMSVATPSPDLAANGSKPTQTHPPTTIKDSSVPSSQAVPPPPPPALPNSIGNFHN